MLKVKDLAVKFYNQEDKVWLETVHKVSFSLERGKVLGIVGESGSGKSVTSFSIMRLHYSKNTEIINYSNYFKFNLQAILTLVFVNVGLNLFFLTQTDLGILGVAYASLIAMTIFNIAKTYFIYTKFLFAFC